MSKKKHQHEEEHENDERWLLTYADLITLLMVFFVVMYAMSQVDQKKFEVLMFSIKSAFVPKTIPLPIPGVVIKPNTSSEKGKSNQLPREAKVKELEKKSSKAEMDDNAKKEQDQKAKLAKLAQQFNQLFAQQGLAEQVNVMVDEKGKHIYIRLADSLLFGPGSATLSTPATDLIFQMFSIVSKIRAKVQVEGHTDSIPMKGGKWRSNWELSTARAVSVVEYITGAIKYPPELLSASGYGEHHPVAPNDTLENQAKNRRVEFVITDAEIADEGEAESEAAPPAAEGATETVETAIGPMTVPTETPAAPSAQAEEQTAAPAGEPATTAPEPVFEPVPAPAPETPAPAETPKTEAPAPRATAPESPLPTATLRGETPKANRLNLPSLRP